MKIGRNELCPCGSDKKYKKCCLSKDEEQRLTQREAKEPKKEHFLEEKSIFNKADVLLEPFFQTEFNDIDEGVSKLSSSEQKIINDWWDDFESVYLSENIDPLECVKKIKEFTQKHPSLLPHLGLDQEALFELHDAFARTNDYPHFIDFLIWLRNNYIEAYHKDGSGFQFDFYIISYLLTHSRIDEIPAYFSLFHEYPDEDPDQLIALINLFYATNNQDLLIKLLERIFLQLYKSPNVIGGDSFVFPIFEHTYLKHFKRDLSSQDIDQLMNDINSLAKELPDLGIYTDREYWENLREEIFTRKYSDKYPKTKKNIEQYYIQVTNHFLSYLYENKNKTWLTARYYSLLVRDYLLTLLENKKRSKKPFPIEKERITNFLRNQFIHAFTLQEVPALAFFEALTFFVDYLEKENLLTSEEEGTESKSIIQHLFIEKRHLSMERCYAAKMFLPEYTPNGTRSSIEISCN